MRTRLSQTTVKRKPGHWLATSSQAIAIVALASAMQPNIAHGQDEDGIETHLLSKLQVKSSGVDERTGSQLKELWYARTLVDKAKEAKRTDLPYARELLNKAVNIVAQATGADSFECGQCLAELGSVDLDLYKFKDAIEEFEKAKSIQQRYRTEYKFHNLVAVSSNLATAYRKNGDFKIAERMYKENLLEFHRESHLADIDYSLNLLAVACLYLDMNEPEKAFNYVHDAQQSAGAKSSRGDAIVRYISSSFARYYSVKRDYAESNRYFERAVASFQRSDDPELCTYAEIICGYSESLTKQAKYDKATAVLSDKADAIEKCLGRDHPLVHEIRDRSAKLKNQHEGRK